MTRLFGRHAAKDIRDLRHRLSAKRPTRQSRNWSDKGWHGDQGSEPSCVGYGWAHWLHSAPIRQWLDPSGIYELAQHYDEWEGTWYDGTSVRGAAKVLQVLGAIDRYEWTWDAAVVASHILNTSPVVIGVDWYEGMNAPNDAGLMSLDGELLGGHCVCLMGYNARNELFRVKNSYGTKWGVAGYAYISLADLQRLLDDDGEACVGVERKLKAA